MQALTFPPEIGYDDDDDLDMQIAELDRGQATPQIAMVTRHFDSASSQRGAIQYGHTPGSAIAMWEGTFVAIATACSSAGEVGYLATLKALGGGAGNAGGAGAAAGVEGKAIAAAGVAAARAAAQAVSRGGMSGRIFSRENFEEGTARAEAQAAGAAAYDAVVAAGGACRSG